MQSSCSKLRFIGVVSLFVCILAFGISAYTKQSSRDEEQVLPYSSVSVLVGAATSTEQTPSEAIPRPNTPLPGQHTPSLFSHGGVLRRITTSSTDSASPSLETVVGAPPPYASESKHGRFHWHKRSQISKHDDNADDSDNDQFNPQPKPVHNPPSTIQTSSAAATTTSSLTNNKPPELPSPSPSTKIHTSQPTTRSTSSTYSYPYDRTDNPISKPGLIILSLGSIILLGLLLCVGWMIVWRDFGLDILWEEVRMLSADC